MKSQIIEIGSPFVEVDNYTVCLEDLSIEFGSEIGFNPENETLPRS